ncbi:aconitase family protein [Variovorax sp. WS11]|uniref:aconitase family protein n=1 Tax=Variovorax sp. WS11 TaxID=1105204 RepID=UPI0021591233|nr:aconitase family protein [Variovorax sp. WS11]
MRAAHWRTLASDDGAQFDAVVEIDAEDVAPVVTWDTPPEMVVPVAGRVPDPAQEGAGEARGHASRVGVPGTRGRYADDGDPALPWAVTAQLALNRGSSSSSSFKDATGARPISIAVSPLPATEHRALCATIARTGP